MMSAHATGAAEADLVEKIAALPCLAEIDGFEARCRQQASMTIGVIEALARRRAEISKAGILRASRR